MLRARLIAFLKDTKFAKFHDIMKIPLKACLLGEPLRPYIPRPSLLSFSPPTLSVFENNIFELKIYPLPPHINGHLIATTTYFRSQGVRCGFI